MVAHLDAGHAREDADVLEEPGPRDRRSCGTEEAKRSGGKWIHQMGTRQSYCAKTRGKPNYPPLDRLEDVGCAKPKRNRICRRNRISKRYHYCNSTRGHTTCGSPIPSPQPNFDSEEQRCGQAMVRPIVVSEDRTRSIRRPFAKPEEDHPDQWHKSTQRKIVRSPEWRMRLAALNRGNQVSI